MTEEVLATDPPLRGATAVGAGIVRLRARVGLPVLSLAAFIIGLGCGAVGQALFGPRGLHCAPDGFGYGVGLAWVWAGYGLARLGRGAP